VSSACHIIIFSEESLFVDVIIYSWGRWQYFT